MLTYEQHEALSDARRRLDAIRGIFDLDRLLAKMAQIEEQQSQPGFWDDPVAAQTTLRTLSRVKSQVQPFESLDKRQRDLAEFLEMLQAEPDEDLAAEAGGQVMQFMKDLDAYELQTLLSGEHDDRNVILEINAGAGGSEACDWASMLLRMYLRWVEERGFKAEILNETPGDVTGYRNVGVEIQGNNAYGYLKSEHGVHRLVRISPFDASARRHTSFCKVEVIPEIEETEIDIDPQDLRIDTLRASGAGGQHVNKTESAVRITHIPSGIAVMCQNERSQHKNKASAMKMLASKLQEIQRVSDSAKMSAIKGDTGPAEWGRQIRSYVMQPYTMVKDHRTGQETGNVLAVMDGSIDEFIEAFLKRPPGEDDFIE